MGLRYPSYINYAHNVGDQRRCSARCALATSARDKRVGINSCKMEAVSAARCATCHLPPWRHTPQKPPCAATAARPSMDPRDRASSAAFRAPSALWRASLTAAAAAFTTASTLWRAPTRRATFASPTRLLLHASPYTPCSTPPTTASRRFCPRRPEPPPRTQAHISAPTPRRHCRRHRRSRCRSRCRFRSRRRCFPRHHHLSEPAYATAAARAALRRASARNLNVVLSALAVLHVAIRWSAPHLCGNLNKLTTLSLHSILIDYVNLPLLDCVSLCIRYIHYAVHINIDT